MGARVVMLVRHGEYTPDPEVLTERGAEQIRLLAERIAARGPVHKLWCSTLPRAIASAAILGRVLGLTPVRRRDLCERPMTAPPRFPPPPSMPPPDRDGAAEVDALVERYLAPSRGPAAGPARREVIVCHGNVVRLMACRALGLDAGVAYDLGCGHASLTGLVVTPEGRRAAVSINDQGHLPAALITH